MSIFARFFSSFGLSLLLGTLGYGTTAVAQSTSADRALGLDEVVVVANRMPEPLSKVGNSVTVLTDLNIQASQAVSVADLLVTTPGISMVRNGALGAVTSVFIRGADSDQTLVLIDGVALNEPASPSGGFDFSSLLTSDVARIEIVRGAQSVLYGSQAIGGVINVITSDPTNVFEGHASVEGGSHSTSYLTSGFGGKDGALTYKLAGSYYNTAGIPAFDEQYGGKRLTGSRMEGLTGSVRYEFNPNTELDLHGYAAREAVAFDGYNTLTYTFGDDSEHGVLNELIGYVGLKFKAPSVGLTNRIAFQYTDTDRRNFDPYAGPITETFYGVGHNMRTEYQGAWEISPIVSAVFGAQDEHTTIRTDTPAYDYPAPTPLSASASIQSGFGQLQLTPLHALTLTAGGRVDRHSVFGSHSTAQIAGAWALYNERTVLRSSFSQGFKAPTLYQLYGAYGNIALLPETSSSWDVGFEHHAHDNSAMIGLSYFRRVSRDLINFFDCANVTPLCATEPYGYYANISESIASGIELQARIYLTNALSTTANYTYTNTKDASVGTTTLGNVLPRRPKNSANFTASYQFKKASASVSVRYSGMSFDDPANHIALGGYTLVDIRGSYPVGLATELYARLENLTDRHYETAYQYGQLGRVGFLGARTKF